MITVFNNKYVTEKKHQKEKTDCACKITSSHF